ncbi:MULTISPECIES: PAS domain-containing protein [Pseudanabaena]|uniref:histidine kinase n=2 Tax=Pseudanabaena TaxID=1152 RepID=L8MWQ3_9CYAN|nr:MULTISPECIES: PAS domain-containing protein [Pseudanabaena]ELS31911.1 multi-sensor signal transduction histidine kinase [Pseudanabaena biceps PCC 7429]MDG3495842.1 PAS domain-containing protein [Pseudanabaena catenata USMAC16]
MSNHADDFTLNELRSAIVRNILTVSPETPVIEAIAQMLSFDSDHTDGNDGIDEDYIHQEARSRCVLVVDKEKVIGIFTERDVFRLSVHQRSLEQLTMQAVMTSPVIAIQESEFTDFLAVMHLLQKHRIRNLPILDDSDRPLGLLTQESLWQLSLSQLLIHQTAQKEVIGISKIAISRQQAAIQKLKSAEQALKIQRDFNQLIAEISSRFIDVSPHNLDVEIVSALQLVCKATNSDTSYLIKYDIAEPSDDAISSLPEGTVSVTHAWSKPEYSQQMTLVKNIPLTLFPWSHTQLLQRQIVNIPNVADVPVEAAIDRSHWQKFHLVSNLSVPLIQKSVVKGLIGFASFSHVTHWDGESIRLLQVMGQAIANIQERIQSEYNLQVSENRLRLALCAANQGLYDLDLLSGSVIVNAEYAMMLGYDPDTFQETNAKWMERMHPDDRDRTLEIYTNYIAGVLPDYEVEFRQRTKTGEWKWILSLGKIVARDEWDNPVRMIGTHTDISDRKKAEAEKLLAEQVRKELKLLESLFDIILAGYWDWDIQTNEEYLSEGFKKMFGYEDAELPNSPETWQNLIFAEDLVKVLESFDRHVESHGALPYRNEVRYRHKDGSTVWVICLGKVIEWDGDRPLRMIGCHIDISDRKKSEEALRLSEERLNLALEAAGDGLWDWNIPTGDLYLSPQWAEMIGFESNELAADVSVWEQLIHPDDKPWVMECLNAHFADATVPYKFDYRVRTKSGKYCWIANYGKVVRRDAEGNPLRMIGTHRDMTISKQTEEKLRKSDTHLKTAQRIGKLGSWEFDPHKGRILWSDEMFQIFGRDPQLGTPSFEELQQLIHPDDREFHQQLVQSAISEIQPYNLEIRFYRFDGSLGYLQSRGEPIVDEVGHLLLLIGTALDITDRKQSEAKLRQTTAQLAASNHELEAFAYSVSHDLRSPLRAIDGFSKALIEDYGDKFDDDAKDYFDRIRRNVSRMGTLIEDLLRLSRVSRSEMQYGQVNLSQLVQEQLDELKALEPDRQVEIAIADGVVVLADLALMRIAISNLIQNAWKFTSHHPIARIEFGVIASHGDRANIANIQDDQLVYFVRDDGAGFDMNYANLLFGVFQRLHNTNEFAGTGIGLATVQRAIHRHGGQVWAEGAVEKGATFYFTLADLSLVQEL